jgi:hypothetical protein
MADPGFNGLSPVTELGHTKIVVSDSHDDGPNERDAYDLRTTH